MALASEVGMLSKGDKVELVHVHIFEGTDEVRLKGNVATCWIPAEFLN